MKKNEYSYVIGERLQVYKIKTATINRILEYFVSPVSIQYEIDNDNIKELLETIESELKENTSTIYE